MWASRLTCRLRRSARPRRTSRPGCRRAPFLLPRRRVTSTATTPALSHKQILVIYSGLVLSMLLGALDSTIVATALPPIVGEPGGLSLLSWVVTASLLAQTVVTPLYGKLGDLSGRKRVLQT